MERETRTARLLQRIANELGVPVASFHAQAGQAHCDSEVMHRAVAALLSAFATVRAPEERQSSIAVVFSEARRLRNLAGCIDGE
jgi:hypothetical protein